MSKIYQKIISRDKDPAKRKNGGFTLIELLVVVLIIGILAAVALPQYQMAVAKTRLTNYYQMLANIRRAQEIYYLANGIYTEDLSVLDVDYTANCQSGQDTSILICPYATIDNIMGVLNTGGSSYLVACSFFLEKGKSSNQWDVRLLFYFQQSSKPNEIECQSQTEKGIRLCKLMGL